MAHPYIFASPDPNRRTGTDRAPSDELGAPDNAYLALARRVLLSVPDADMWQVEAATIPKQAGDWMRVSHREAVTPLQGWKLHISATIGSAEEVLARALPVLISLPTSFKVAATSAALLNLNQGAGGLSQVGKFITVYPTSDEQMLRLAPLLDAALAGLPGPAVPSDRRYRPGSLVHYRYGSFSSRHTQLPTGEVVPAIEDQEGEPVADRRLTRFEAPEWAVDPFAEAGAARSLPARRWVGERYLILSALHSSPRGGVYLALNFENRRCCVLKSAPRHAAEGLDGYDSQDRLRNEAQILSQLAPHPAFPALYDLLEHDGDLYLAMEDIEGETLMQRVGRLSAQGAFLPDDLVAEWGISLARMLGHLHVRGLIYRDVKPTNVLVTLGGTLRLIDLELCVPHDQGEVPAAGIGTIGYSSPQQTAGGRPGVADDVYGLGALLYFLATGAEPSTAPNSVDLLARPIEWLNPDRSPALAAVIRRCLHPQPDARYPTMKAVASALSRAVTRKQSAQRKTEILPPSALTASDPCSHYRDLAYRLAGSLCEEAVIAPEIGGYRDGLAWISRHQGGHGLQLRDINIGSAGAVLALAALVAELGDPRHRDVLERAARHLARTRPLARRPLPGLYVGEAGVGTALLRAGQALHDCVLIEAAEQAGSRVSALPHASPDLFNGTAGRLRFHLWLFAATGGPAHLDCALAAGEHLLTSAVAPAQGELLWEIPPGYDGLSGHAYLGYAHGAAGIGDALHDLYLATGQERFLAAALAAARWLERPAPPSPPDSASEGIAWPVTPGAPPSSPFWCHGAAGIARFFLHLSDVDAFPQAMTLAEQAATSATNGARWAGPTQCHGLAGNIELLLDMRATTRDAACLTAAYDLARLLETMAVERDGLLLWPSDSGSAPTPDFMVGYAGVAACLLRLSAPERLPNLL